MKNTLPICAALTALLVLAACGLSPEQKQSLLDGLAAAHDAGHLSDSQYEAAVESVTGGGFAQWLEVLSGSLVAVVGGYFGLRKPIANLAVRAVEKERGEPKPLTHEQIAALNRLVAKEAENGVRNPVPPS